MAGSQLSQEAIEAIKKAKEAQGKLASLGIPLEPAEEVSSEIKKSYENFIEITNLPSKGNFYTEQVKGQALKVEDLLLIQNINEENSLSRFNEVFNRRIRGVTPLDILSADELYIALWLRESSYPGYTFPHPGYTCPKCNIDIPSDAAEFGFESLAFESNITEILESYNGKEFVEFTLKPDIKCKMTLKRRVHESRVNSVLQRDFYQYNIKPPDGISELLELLSVVDFGIPDLMEAANTFMKFDANTFNEYLKYYKKYSLAVDIVVNLKCPNPNCLEVSPVYGYPFRPEIYFPDNI